jgi:hypothetical protein
VKTVLSNWRFFRAGGFDQVRLDTAAELLAIAKLDQKLWVALSCPVKGIEFDARTLACIDSNGDGQVRAPELIAALQWADERLGDAEVLVTKLPGVPLAAIRCDDELGLSIAAAAKQLLADVGATDGIVTVAAATEGQALYAERATAVWQAAGSATRLLGEATDAAHAALAAVADKIDDWFVRCRLAAFDQRAGDALNASTEAFMALGATTLSQCTDAIAALPLARVAADATLPLVFGLNPAWADRMATLCDTVLQPLLGSSESLTENDWQALKQKFQPFAQWQASKPEPALEHSGLRGLEQLARYVRDLQSLANNFVAFRDFYTRQGPATFQVGTLYLDGRSCDLCVAVTDAPKHAALAALARICLVYVECVRGAERMAVAAAFTAGDSDQLMVGRNGIFYDRQRRDWSATITKIVEHPISLRQAFWSPYKRFAHLVAEQLQKMAASKSAESQTQLSAVAVAGANKMIPPDAAKSSRATTAAPFDVAKFAGVFAAIGLAVGAIGTLLASLISGLFALAWWQLPLALAGLTLLISAPAVVLAWFKLRSRNLGPLLDANGWAINARARINIPFGSSLTQVAQLPQGAERSLVDPYAEAKMPWAWFLAVGVLAALIVAWKTGLF